MRVTNKGRALVYRPTCLLANYIDRFYVFKRLRNNYAELPPVLPGTGLELVFYLKNPLSVNNEVLPKAHTVCPRKIFYFDNEKDVTFLSVRFKSGAFRHFTSIPFSFLNNKFLSVQEIWKDKGKELMLKLQHISEVEALIKAIEVFLLEVYEDNHNTEDDKWDLIIKELYYNFDQLSIRQIAQKTHLSLRQFERKFKSQFGTTAKEFQKIARFQAVIKSALLFRQSYYLDTILEVGYFDQSHFIREFKSLTNKTPLEYFSKENFDTHFYHTPLT